MKRNFGKFREDDGNLQNLDRGICIDENSVLPVFDGKSKRCNKEVKNLITHQNGLLIYLPNIHRRASQPYLNRHNEFHRPSLDPSHLQKDCASKFQHLKNRPPIKIKKRTRRRRRKKKKKNKNMMLSSVYLLKVPPIQPSVKSRLRNVSPKKKKPSYRVSPMRPLLKKRRRRVPKVKITCRCVHGIDCLNRRRINGYSLIDKKRSIYVNASSNQTFRIEKINKFRSPLRYDEIRYEMKILRDHIRKLHPNIFSFTEIIDDFSDDHVYLVYPYNKKFFEKSNSNKIITLKTAIQIFRNDYCMIEMWNKQLISLMNFLFVHRNLVISDISPPLDFLVDLGNGGNIMFRGITNLQFMNGDMYDEYDIRNCEVNMINIIGETLFYMCFGEEMEYDDYGKIIFNNNELSKDKEDRDRDSSNKMNKNNIPKSFLDLILKTCTDEPMDGLDCLEDQFAKSSRDRRREKRKNRRKKKEILKDEVGRLEQIIRRIDLVFCTNNNRRR